MQNQTNNRLRSELYINRSNIMLLIMEIRNQKLNHLLRKMKENTPSSQDTQKQIDQQIMIAQLQVELIKIRNDIKKQKLMIKDIEEVFKYNEFTPVTTPQFKML